MSALLADSTAFIWCIGAQLTCTGCPTVASYGVILGFKGVINNIRMYNYKLTNA